MYYHLLRCFLIQKFWFFFDDFCVDDSHNFDVGDLITSLDNPERHGKAKVRLREEIDEKYHSLSDLVAQREGQPQLPTLLRREVRACPCGRPPKPQDNRAFCSVVEDSSPKLFRGWL